MTVIRKDELAPARTLDPRRLKQVIDARIKIANGAQAGDWEGDNYVGDGGKKVCIMEAACYILGYGAVHDSPPCTSAIIRDFMINLNDDEHVSDRQRAKMKHVIPDIVNTAPTHWRKYKRHPYGDNVVAGTDGFFYKFMQNESDPDYKEAERKRSYMVAKFTENYQREYAWNEFKWRCSMDKIIDFIRELADVARFDGNSEPPQTEVQA